ncbi:MAG: CBS domain-containing protein [Gemmatimonadota bacterium]
MSSFQVPVDLYMTPSLVQVLSTESLDAAQERMISARISSLPVVDEKGRPVGVISRTDLLRVGRKEAGSLPRSATLTLPDRAVSEAMTDGIRTVDRKDTLERACQIMVKERLHRVYVTEGEALVGVVSPRDVLVAIREKKINRPVRDIMSSPVFTIRADEPISLAVERLEKARVTGLVVVEGNDPWPVGLFTQREALEAADVARHTSVEEVMSSAFLALEPDTRLYRAAAQAAALGARRVVVSDGHGIQGIVTGLDFCRLAS